MMGKKVLITGGTGLIGRHLTKILLKKGYEVAYLSRKKKDIPSVRVFEWNFENGYLEEGALDNLHFLVHLAGEGVAESRWTEKQKKNILSSRIDTISFLADQLKKQKVLPAAFVSASGSSYYGEDSGNVKHTESSPPGNDFLSQVTIQWEKAADLIKDQDVRTVKLRTGVVLSKDGGALPQIAAPAKFGFGAPLGSGKQWIPWIHIDDICQMYVDALENESWQGAYNAVATPAVTNEELTKQICMALNKPQWLPNVPAFALKLVFGKMASVVLGSSYLINERIVKETNFKYRFPEIGAAVKEALV
ncbi:TIGR01777 family oxidoreductase [Dyadobacter sp. CY323]|uniref:TIGR01777 family oxidoreductase n=1 Tax=Dyadobacter sp. CY323 TaxID=2907302 RepID=UPI001F359504|nr:TIGR01777 family oxidoreductase [Dyadobacter sp. CY323]MCE6990534.1 TIGR01777 family oxidoreductase [Dyadobacter sp. CY323]